MMEDFGEVSTNGDTLFEVRTNGRALFEGGVEGGALFEGGAEGGALPDAQSTVTQSNLMRPSASVAI